MLLQLLLCSGTALANGKPLLLHHQGSTPEFGPLFASMAINVHENTVQLRPASPGAKLRSQIAAAKNL